MRKQTDALYGLPINYIAAICRVSAKTAARWKAGQVVPPYAALALIDGDLGALDPGWAGWRFRDGELVSPEGWTLTLGDARSAPFVRAQVATLISENRQLRGIAQSFGIDQPEPAEAPQIVPVATLFR